MKSTEALALKIACNLSDSHYLMMRNASLHHKANIYLTLHQILMPKNFATRKTYLLFMDTTARCCVQSMVNHSLRRILEPESVCTQIPEKAISARFFLKIGMDGASSQSIYMLKFVVTDLSEATANKETIPNGNLSAQDKIW